MGPALKVELEVVLELNRNPRGMEEFRDGLPEMTLEEFRERLVGLALEVELEVVCELRSTAGMGGVRERLMGMALEMELEEMVLEMELEEACELNRRG
jgi:hypothetical protein